MDNVKTLSDALALGYKLADQQYQRGYVSRKIDLWGGSPVHVAGGSRRGELYILRPAWSTSQYCIRQYLRKA